MRMTSVVRLPLTYSPLVPGTTRARDDFVQLHGAIYLTRRPASAKARPVALSDFIFSGGAGIPRLTEDEVNEFRTDVTERKPVCRRSWLKLAPIDGKSESWVAYPQR